MIPIYVCDDEAAIRRFLQKEIEDAILVENHDMELTLASGSAGAVLQAARADGRRGVYFLDIDLNDSTHTGFTLAAELRRIDPRGFIIFVTTHAELALETFRHRLEAMDYIVKDDMVALPARLRQCLASVAELLILEKRDASAQYTIKVFDVVHHVPVRQILYFATSSQKHRIVLHTDDSLLHFFDNLQSIQSSVGAGFWRVHRSYLVNRGRIKQVLLRENQIELDNGERIPLSRKAKKEI